MASEVGSVSAILVDENRVEIRERRAGSGADSVINILLSFVPTIIRQLETLTQESGKGAA
jgi:hypothetical protein